MKLNKIKAIFPAIALFLTASMTSCMDDLEKGMPVSSWKVMTVMRILP